MLRDALEQRRDGAVMPRVGGPDPVVVAALQPLPEALEPRRHEVHPGLGLDLVLFGGLEHGLGVLVHAHEEMDVVAPEPPVTRDAVGAHLLERVAEMGVAVGIVDGGREVKLGHAGS